MTETWLETGAWERLQEKVSRKFNWIHIPATREKAKGRAKGGIVIATSKSLKEVSERMINKEAMEVSFKHNNNQ